MDCREMDFSPSRPTLSTLARPTAVSLLPAQTENLLQAARWLYLNLNADAVLLLTETPLPWDEVRAQLGDSKLLVAGTTHRINQQLQELPDLTVLNVDDRPMPIRERLSLCLLEALTQELLPPHAQVLVLYNGLEVEDGADQVDSISLVRLGESLERLRAQDLRRLDTQVPIETLKAVVDLASEIGREGREGKPVGTIFVVGDSRKVLSYSRVLGFDPVRGYSRKERNLRDRRVREAMKEIAKLDGAILVDKQGVVIAAARYIDVLADGITLSKGLGSRHWAAAAISRRTRAIAVAVSESTGVVRVFQNGEIVLHLAPYSRPILWRTIRETDDDEGTPARGPQVPLGLS